MSSNELSNRMDITDTLSISQYIEYNPNTSIFQVLNRPYWLKEDIEAVLKGEFKRITHYFPDRRKWKIAQMPINRISFIRDGDGFGFIATINKIGFDSLDFISIQNTISNSYQFIMDSIISEYGYDIPNLACRIVYNIHSDDNIVAKTGYYKYYPIFEDESLDILIKEFTVSLIGYIDKLRSIRIREYAITTISLEANFKDYSKFIKSNKEENDDED